MATSSPIPVYLELGAKRVFAGALDWPGWCLSGRDEASALEALSAAGPRYAQVVRPARLGFEPPRDARAFEVVERLKGDATTDFGAPAKVPKADAAPVNTAELRRLEKILKACWAAFDAAAEAAEGRALRKGPRGGGRELDGIWEHTLLAEIGYLRGLGGKFKEERSLIDERKALRAAVLDTLEASARGEIPAKGPRGGRRWSPRYFVRRAAWHVVDHTWEIENRLEA
jgi:hypothetical protein